MSTMKTRGCTAYFIAGCFLVGAVLRISPAGAFTPSSMVPGASTSGVHSRCRSHSVPSSVDRPRRKLGRSRGWHIGHRLSTQLSSTDIESPFATPGVADPDDDDDAPLPLTLENVEIVLDEMRPYLMSDG